ncbi:FAD-binding oxidoreductase [Actinacidiphila sp. bgisy145]|uniref:FAD-binding oxidoreductase n=1 Tax=Actinacidiphila sp. bgisy145 TaxID=3413792 RepID=UPI003EC14390
MTAVAGAAPAEHGTSRSRTPARIPTRIPAVTPADDRYPHLAGRGRNTRFAGRPQEIHLPTSAAEVAAVVQAAVDGGRRLAVRSGGHCLENLVDGPAVQSLVDLSALQEIRYDAAHRAFSVQAGAQLGPTYRALYLGWGAALPAGTCPSVGLGGYVQGAGFGPMCRSHGLIVDHLYGIEVVTVDADRRARTVLATRRPDDPHRELWWAHTGAGGGNFGVVTRYLFRSPEDADFPRGLSAEASALPRPPRSVLTVAVEWPWEGLGEADFSRIVRNHGAWHAHDEAAGDGGYDTLYSGLYLNQRSVGQVVLTAQIDGSLPDADQRLRAYVAAVGDGVRAPYRLRYQQLPWLDSVQRDVENRGAATRSKSKGAYLRRPYDAEQIATLWRHLSEPGYQGHTVALLFSYGRAVNRVAPQATAAAQRDSILKAYLGTYWEDPREDEHHVARIREFYAQLYAATGGVPAPDTATDGSYINYPDADLADPRWNTSGIPWHALYFKDGYPRLQQVKRQWDPHDAFRHALSVRPPAPAE